jgi:hypothetical protein
VIKTIKRLIKAKYGEKCDDSDVLKTLERIVCEKFDPLTIKLYRSVKAERKPRKPATNEAMPMTDLKLVEKVTPVSPPELN